MGDRQRAVLAPFIFLKVETTKDTSKYKLSDRFATFSVKSIGYTDKTITSLTIVNNKDIEVFSFGKQQKSEKDSPKPAQKPKTELDLEKGCQINLFWRCRKQLDGTNERNGLSASAKKSPQNLPLQTGT